MTVVTPTDRPKSVNNRCVIEVVGGVFVLYIGFRIFCWYRGFSSQVRVRSFYAPRSNDIVFVLSVFLSVCLSVCLLSTLTFALTFEP